MDLGQAWNGFCATEQGQEEKSLLPSGSHLPPHCPELPLIPPDLPSHSLTLHLHHGAARH